MNFPLSRAFSPATLIAAIGLATVLAVGAGCQERVVEESYGPPRVWTSERVEYRAPATREYSSQPEQPAEKKNFFEEVGDTLFGWMKDDPPAEDPPRSRRFDPIWTTPQLGQ